MMISIPLWAYAVLCCFWLWMAFVSIWGSRILRFPDPDKRKLKTTFQLADSEQFRQFVPNEVFWKRERAAYRLSIATAVFLFSFFGLLSVVSDRGRWYLIFWIGTAALASIVAEFWLLIHRVRSRRALCVVGANDLLDDQSDNRRTLPLVAAPFTYSLLQMTYLISLPSTNLGILGLLLAFLLMCVWSFAAYYRIRKQIELYEDGFFDTLNFTSWDAVVAYHWYAHRRGVLVVRGAEPFSMPLVILPVPEDKADEVERILAEYLPGKRGEDVDFSAVEENSSEQTLTVSHS